MSRAKIDPQIVVLTPLLVGTDGTQKMSQSLGNIISVNDTPEDMFGKVMSISDVMISDWWRALQLPNAGRLKDLDNGENPKNVKKELACHIVNMLCGDNAMSRALSHFESTFEKRDWRSTAEEVSVHFEDINRSLASCMVDCGLASSSSDAKRLIQSGAVELDGTKVQNPTLLVSASDIDNKFIKVGKRRFAKLVVTQ
jgi:tyrosyl-tRNA synthetase